MRQAAILFNGQRAGVLSEHDNGTYAFHYDADYSGPPISLTLPMTERHYTFDHFPSFFDGLLPEGFQLEALLRLAKLDRDDCFGQLITVGRDMVGAVTVEVIS